MPEELLMREDNPHDRDLVEHVHPPSWTNPRPSGRYNLVVIGGGTAGLVTAAGAAGLGARVALVERLYLGGDCLNFGCVPSKALVRAARASADVRDAGRYGTQVPPGARVDFAGVMDRMRRLRASIARHDSAARFRGLGVDVFLGEAKFTGRDTVQVGPETLRFRKACIATGARAAAPPIPGLADAGYLTNETVFSLTALPPRLGVIGGGPIGCELAQCFARFGSRVTLFQSAARILPRDDAEAAGRVDTALRADSIDVLLRAKITGVSSVPTGKRIRCELAGEAREVEVDAILVGVGRAPNVEGLDFEAAGVEYSKEGVKVNDFLETSNPRIFAAGDICLPFKFTHTADAAARIVIQNALFRGSARVSRLVVPWCTYTDPELAHVGLDPDEAAARGHKVQVFTQELNEVDRAVLDGEGDGLAKVFVKEGTDRILGATVVARHAGEMLSEITLAMVAGRGLGAIARCIHPYPTQSEVWKRLADAYQRTRLTPGIKKLFESWLSWTR